MNRKRARRKGARRKGRTAFIVAFLAPAVSLYALLVVLPVLQAFQFSLYRWRGVSAQKTFVGLENFRRLFMDKVFWLSLQHNLWLLVGSAVALLGLGLLVAHGLQGEGRLTRTMRGVYLFPQMISLVVVSIFWLFLYNPSFGLLSGLLRAVGFGRFSVAWLGEPRTAFAAVGVTYVWYSLGFYIMILAAGIRGIPAEIAEAATLDGAFGMTRFRMVTLPLLWSVMRVSVVYLVIHAVNVFAIVFLMTQGGPDRRTEMILTYLYEQAFQRSEFGLATALAVVNFVLVMGLSAIVLRVYRRDPSGAAA